LNDFFPTLQSLEKPDPEALLIELSKQRVLNCLRVVPQGADAINEMALKRTMSIAQRGKWWWAPIMIVSNDEETGLYNGEMGIYMERKDKRGTGFAYFSKDRREIPYYALPKFEWAFCSSVHKSQGSEFDEVIIMAPQGSEIFGREMLYTAITRAKRSIKIVGQKQTLQAMLDKTLLKHSGLV
jgi:exodeoxyribonuclease V alpha subunit